MLQRLLGDTILTTSVITETDILGKPLFLKKMLKQGLIFILKCAKLYFSNLFREHPVDKIKNGPIERGEYLYVNFGFWTLPFLAEKCFKRHFGGQFCFLNG